jgi:hypothetical protein
MRPRMGFSLAFELPSEGDEETMPPPLKQSKRSTSAKDDSRDFEDEEELALRLLRDR